MCLWTTCLIWNYRSISFHYLWDRNFFELGESYRKVADRHHLRRNWRLPFVGVLRNSFRNQKRSQPPTNNGPPSTRRVWEPTCIKCLVDRISRNDLSLTTNHKDNNIKLLIFTALHLTFSFFWRSESLCCCYSFFIVYVYWAGKRETMIKPLQ